jgi:hypothetical protein
MTTTKFNSLVFSALGFVLPDIANISIFVILSDFCL